MWYATVCMYVYVYEYAFVDACVTASTQCWLSWLRACIN